MIIINIIIIIQVMYTKSTLDVYELSLYVFDFSLWNHRLWTVPILLWKYSFSVQDDKLFKYVVLLLVLQYI